MKRVLTMVLLFSLLIMGGCKEKLPDYTLGTAPSTEPTGESPTTIPTQPREWREYPTYPVERPTDNAIGNIWYNDHERVVNYYDADLRRNVVLCSQPNCTHTDSKCVAYLGEDIKSDYIVLGDLVYAVVDNSPSDGGILLIERNLITGDTKTLWDLTPGENTLQEQFDVSLCGQELFLTFRQHETEYWFEGYQSFSLEKNTVQYSYAIDRTTGERELLLEAEIPAVQGYVFNGSHIIPRVCTQDYLLIQEIKYGEELPLTVEEYAKQHPQGDYDAYVRKVFREFEIVNHYRVERKTGERERICGDIYEAKLQIGPVCRDRKMVFLENDTVCIYDGYTGEITPCFEFEGDRICSLKYADGRILYNVYPEDMETGVYNYFWYDIQTGERQQFQEGISGMVFSLHGETADYFQGLYNSKRCFISKQDFYNENYDAAF